MGSKLMIIAGKKLRITLGGKMFRRLREIGKTAQELDCTSYLVGGPVRDFFLQRPSKDFDIVVSGKVITKRTTATNLAKELFKIWRKSEKKLKFTYYERFGTATISSPGWQIDFAYARRERYPAPGVLPEVEPGSINDDLSRRDFTINALAMNLDPANFGALIDPTGGIKNLRRKVIRVLHERSFIDDPTRIFRAARFAGRYGFSLEEKTSAWLKEAVKKKVISLLSGQRIREEIIAILKEENFITSLNSLARWKVLGLLHRKIRWDERKARSLRPGFPGESWRVGLLLLIENLNYCETEEIARRIVLRREEKSIILKAKRHLPKILKIMRKLSPPIDSRRKLEIYRYFSLLSEEGLLYLKISQPLWRDFISEYLQKMKKAKPRVSGEDLKKLGYPPGPIYKKILSKIFEQKLLEKLPLGVPKREEIKFVRKNFPR